MSIDDYQINPNNYHATGLSGDQVMFLVILLEMAKVYYEADNKAELLDYYRDDGNITDGSLREVMHHHDSCSECQANIRQLTLEPVYTLTPEEAKNIRAQIEVKKMAGPNHPFNVEAEKERIERCQQTSRMMNEVFYLHVQALPT